MKKLILICGLLASSFSFGADWVTIDDSHDGETQFDVSSIKKLPNNLRLVWHRGVTRSDDEKITYITLRSEINCTMETLQNNDIYIDVNNARILQNRIDNPKPFSPPPDSGGQKLIHAVCKAP
ncbi:MULTISPECIES: hypothetical protein [unclassified Acinetobacter]|uniref:hypothetical protein n=1 Tax=unclassified Acinetobacter TaxID=196816 RepID=UPI0015D0D527|nr:MULTISPECIES: hypothetical protein [unclassified Acinetobacter]